MPTHKEYNHFSSPFSQGTEALKEIVGKRHPLESPTGCNCNSRSVLSVYDNLKG